MIEREVVRSPERLSAIAQEILDASVISLDLETTSLSPYFGKIRLLSVNTGKGVYVIDAFETKTLEPVISALRQSKGVKCLQNAKFDQKFLLHYHDLELYPVFDTFRASAILYNGKNLGNDLYSLYGRELGIAPEAPDLGGSDWTGPLTDEQYDYAAEDVTWLPKLRDVLRPKVISNGLSQIAMIEFNAILPEASLELNGFFLDKERWRSLAQENEIQAKALEKQLLWELPHPLNQIALPGFDPDWNIDSTAQMLVSLTKLGLKIPDTKEITLAMEAAKYPIVQKVLDYRGFSKKVTQFGADYLDHINKVTGRVHSDFYPFTGAGRYSCVPVTSRVSTDHGIIPIGEVRPGYLIQTPSGPRKVMRYVDTGSKPILRFDLEGGRTLRCTADHVVMCDGKWTKAGDIQPGQCLHASRIPGPDSIPSMEQVGGANTLTNDSMEAFLRWGLVAELASLRVSSISEEPSEPVCDIEVEGDHSFLIDGIVVHNCSRPNLQQIPRDKAFRKCFRAPDGKVLVIEDYSQIELRGAAEISRDPMLIKVYQEGKDAHAQTASLVSGVPLDQVTKVQRQMAKAINFGLIYGMAAPKLVLYAQSTYGVSMTLEQALLFRKNYFEGYPGVAAWHRNIFSDENKRSQMVRTILGRLRYLKPEAHNEYSNTPVQGSSADGLKASLAIVYKKLKKYGGAAKIVNIVHDEIVTECDSDPELVHLVEKDVNDGMVEGMQPMLKRVPVVVEGGSGSSWAEK